MLPIVLSGLSVILFGWFVYELVLARKFAREGVRLTAVVSKWQWVRRGRSRNLQVAVTFRTEQGPKESLLGFSSWWGFRKFQVGDPMEILYHPNFRYVLPASMGGICSRPLVAGFLLLASLIVTAAFTLRHLIQ